MGLLVLGLLAAAAWLGVRGMQARSALTSAVPQVERLQAQLLAGDSRSAESTLADLRVSTQHVRDLTSDPVWSLASRLPWAGPNLAAVTGVAAGLDDLADLVLPSVVASAGALDLSALAPVDGRIDVAPLTEAAPLVASASVAMATIDARVGAIRTDNILDVVVAPVGDVQAQLHDLAGTLDTAQTATALLPGMLGAEGPRRYLLLLQTNAELRATGGMPGALSIVTADDGRLLLTEQSTASAVNVDQDQAGLALAPEDEALYSERMGAYLSDVNFTPHFPTAARLASGMWQAHSGEVVDGVLATDPVALSYLLAATGPVADGTGGELAAGDSVQMLLSGAYAKFPDTGDQDDYFSAVAASVFASLLDGRASPAATVPALARAAGEHRLLVWSARAEEQAELAGTVLDGAMPAAAGATPAVGVFFNDGTGSKMDYHLDTRVEVVSSVCTYAAPGNPTLGSIRAVHTVRLTMANVAPLDAAESLPESVTGPGIYGAAPGDIETSVVLVGPVAGEILSLERDGRLLGVEAHAQGARPATVLSVLLAPGERTVLDIDMADPAPSRELDVWSTPTKDQTGLFTMRSCH